MNKNKKSFVLYVSFYEPIKNLSLEEKGLLLEAIFEYQANEAGKDLSSYSQVKMAFEFFKNQFRIDDQKYDKIVKRNKINGSKGGRPKNPKNPLGFLEIKKTQKIQKTQSKLNDNDNDNEDDNENDNNIIKEKNLLKLGEFKNVFLTKQEYEKLIPIYIDEKLLQKAIEKLGSWIKTSDKGKECKDHYAILGETRWIYESLKEEIEKEKQLKESLEIIENTRGNLSESSEGREIIDELIKEFGENIYNSWLSKLSLEKHIENKIIFSAPTEFIRDWITKEYFHGIKQICQKINKTIQEINIEVR